MQSAPSSSRPHLFGVLAGLALAGALCFAAIVGAHTWIRIGESQSVNVTGSARKNVRSDLVIWRASFSVEAPTLLDAQAHLTTDFVKISAWLKAKGAADFVTKPVSITEVTARTGEGDAAVWRRVGFRLKQEVEVRSPDVELIPRLASDCTELLVQNVVFVSESFEFIYTKASDAKIEMMAEATRDARTRAEQIAAQGDRKIRELQSARMGVVQINPLYSSATSWDGNNDTTTVEKTITVTMNAVFSLE